jgi:hypothetical protein
MLYFLPFPYFYRVRHPFRFIITYLMWVSIPFLKTF